ncbi:hypothetical protein L5515_008282 [Caenorhabditis briggsae]|uniref:Calponin-homology (CH) domain-containing protein n=1 Tax=Caenorhabditis briggsae TaxID=6238 RepID=A0AAE9JM49_CAEBR|nr:hypothetical protein L5515_008282 [Caenorhabditis briggsae]
MIMGFAALGIGFSTLDIVVRPYLFRTCLVLKPSLTKHFQGWRCVFWLGYVFIFGFAWGFITYVYAYPDSYARDYVRSEMFEQYWILMVSLFSFFWHMENEKIRQNFSAMDSTIERKREAMLQRLASRNEKRTLEAAAAKETTKKIDLRATEKAFLESSPTSINLKTPVNPPSNYTISTPCSSSPILSFDEKAEKQMVALATWTNTMIGLDSTEELDLGATAAEACRRIQKMLGRKNEASEADRVHQAARQRYQRIFEKNDPDVMRKKCKKLLDDSGIEESIRDMLSKNQITIRNEHSVFNDLALQTNLLRTFLCFHPAWLKVTIEAIFGARIDAQPKYMIRALSQFFIERVFSNPSMLKNKKFAQGSGKPIITKQGREALHRHFLETTMKLMFLIETANAHRVIPNLTRIFTKSSQYKCLDDMFSGLTKELLTGSSLTFKKAFAKIGFTPSYKQSFFDNYDYQAKGFADYSDGIILAKLIESVGELPHGELLLKLRDPAGDRIRKINNVKIVLQEMTSIGIPTEDVTPTAIVGGTKDAILAILWSIVGVRVAREKRVKTSRAVDETPKKKRRSAVHDNMSSDVLKTCKLYGRQLEQEVLDLDSLTDGILLDKIWKSCIPNATPISAYSGDSLWEKVVSMAELELGINRGLDQSIALFVKMFLDRMQTVKMYHEKAAIIQKQWKLYLERKNIPKLFFIVQQVLVNHRQQRCISPATTIDNATFVIQNTPGILTERPSLSQLPCTPRSMNSTLNDATFTLSRDSLQYPEIDTLSNCFKQPKTPLRGTFTRHTISKHLNEVIEEEEGSENDETVVPSTLKKRFRVDLLTTQQKTTVFQEENAGIIEYEETSYSREIHTVASVRVHNSEEVYAEESPEIDGKGIETLNISSDDVQNADCEDVIEDLEASSESITPDKNNEEASEDHENAHGPVEISPEDVNVLKNDFTPEVLENDIVADEVSTEANIEPQENVPATLPMDHTQPTSSQSTSSSLVDYEMTEEQKKSEAMFREMIENQKRYVLNNQLNLVIPDQSDTASTPELRKILRETRELKRKQEEVAKRLGAIERKALAEKENAFIEYSTTDEIHMNENDHDSVSGSLDQLERSADLLRSTSPTGIFEKLNNDDDAEKLAKKALEELQTKQRKSAVTIQKVVRGFLARRRFATEIRDWREKMVAYNMILAQENEQLDEDNSQRDETKGNSSAERKLRKCTRRLIHDNLHIVLLAATVIDRLTNLVPSLLDTFVIELNGIKPIYEILAVADQGFAYTSILSPLLKILQKSLLNVPEETSNPVIRPLLQKLSPRLVLLMCKHCQNQEFFTPIVTSLISIARRFPHKKDSFIEADYAIRQTMKKVLDKDGRNYLTTLQNVSE